MQMGLVPNVKPPNQDACIRARYYGNVVVAIFFWICMCTCSRSYFLLAHDRVFVCALMCVCVCVCVCVSACANVYTYIYVLKRGA